MHNKMTKEQALLIKGKVKSMQFPENWKGTKDYAFVPSGRSEVTDFMEACAYTMFMAELKEIRGFIKPPRFKNEHLQYFCDRAYECNIIRLNVVKVVGFGHVLSN